MPTYEYFCGVCKNSFEIIESIKDHRPEGKCPTCQTISKERIFSSAIHFLGASVESAEYNPAFGQVVKNSRHRKELAKARGMVEIGNEKPEAVHKHFDQARADRLKKSWEDV